MLWPQARNLKFFSPSPRVTSASVSANPAQVLGLGDLTTLALEHAAFSSSAIAPGAYFRAEVVRAFTKALWRLDYLNDWRELKLEREIWRSVDTLSGARHHLLFRKKYYSNFYEPTSLLNKVSTWLPNHLLAG